MDNTKQKIDHLRRVLDRLNYDYYVRNAPAAEDREYDRMMAELAALEAAHPEFADPNSPTHRVGSDLTREFQQVAHRYPMLSLANTYSEEEVRDFIARVDRETAVPTAYCCELKFDGTAISLTYENGRFVRAVTRGDGTQGDDVSANVRTIRSIPMSLQGGGWPAYMEVRGEIYMPHESFERLNAERADIGEEPFANPRNAAAGTLKQQNSAVVAKRGLDAVLYAVQADAPVAASHYETLQKLREWGFKTSSAVQLCRSAEEIMAYIRHWDNKAINSFGNLIGNIVAFIPLGYMMPRLHKIFENLFICMATALLFVLGIELFQLFSAFGIFDVDDILLNGLGAFVGYLCFVLMKGIHKRIEKKKEKL